MFPPKQKDSLKKKYETLCRSNSSSGSSSISYKKPVIIVGENRASFPSPAPKFPLRINGIPNASPNLALWGECLAEVNLILEQEELDFNSIRIDIVRGADEKQSRPTILMRVPQGTDKSSWRPILNTIGQMLHVKKALELQVIIMEPEAEERNSAFTVEANDPLIDLWPGSLKDPIHELIEDMEWLELSACKWGPSRDTAKPTVLIIVEKNIEGTWDAVCRKISELCAASGLPHLQIVVEEGELMGGFEEGELVGGLWEAEAGLGQGYRSYQEQVPMGYSIGVEASGGGTLGGYINLLDPKNPSKKTTVFLTTWQVVRPSDPRLPVEWDNGPHKFGDWPKGISNVVHSSARSDLASGIKEQQDRIETIKGGGSWSVLEPKINDGTANDRQQEAFERQVRLVEKIQEQVDYLKSVNNKATLRLGQCKMTSGYRKARLAKQAQGIAGVFALDWAIGEVASERVGGNLLPTQDEIDRITGGPGIFDLSGKTHVKGTSVIPPYSGLEVFKVARTTGLTVGTIDRLASYVKVIRQSNDKHQAPIRTTLELIAVRGGYNRPFNKAGDSGAWVLDQHANLAGLLWGGCEKSNHGYFTPIQLVLDDIEKHTGAKVEIYQGP